MARIAVGRWTIPMLLLALPAAVAAGAGAVGGAQQANTCAVPVRILFMDDEDRGARLFTFTYEVEIPPQRAGSGPIEVFVPLAASDAHQAVLRRDLQASIPGRETTESRYGNRFWHGHLDRSDGKPITIAVDYLVRRRPFQRDRAAAGPRTHSPEEREQLALFLGPDRLGPIEGPVIDRVRAGLPKTDPSPLGRARAIYDFVIDRMEYKEVGAGWGSGATVGVGNAWHGNCTNYQALSISLARAEGIPARFEIGFPIPSDRPSSEIVGYHCWTQLHLPGAGWFPIDALEADRNPALRELYFGGQPADRILFSIGRDLELGEGHASGPLTYFIHPHVEVAGQKLLGVKTHFRFADVPHEQAALGNPALPPLGR